MRTLAFLDCPTGISGDMCLGAVVSAGVPLPYLQTHLAQLKLPEAVHLEAQTVHKNGLAATKVDVILGDGPDGTTPPPVRHLPEIERLIQTAALPERAIAWSVAIFRRLAIAEGAIHGIAPQQVHFHEVGATDAIIDIVGTCLGLDWLGIDELHCAPLPTGRGTIRAAHGRLPVPAPAVLQLMAMAQVPIYHPGLEGELVTPTGAAIATELATRFGDPPAMRLHRVGLGAGTKDFAQPNILRLWLGSALTDGPSHQPPDHRHAHDHAHNHSPDHSHVPAPPPPLDPLPGVETAPPPSPTPAAIEQRAGQETVVVLETQVDDLSPQVIGYVYDRLLQGGALDVFTHSALMKKSRPGHVITVIAYPDRADSCEQILLQETTTLGVRRMVQTRQRLRRAIVPVATAWGTIRMKLAYDPHTDTLLKAHPEYEDCAAIARQHHVPWRAVHQQALCQWQAQQAAAIALASTDAPSGKDPKQEEQSSPQGG